MLSKYNIFNQKGKDNNTCHISPWLIIKRKIIYGHRYITPKCCECNQPGYLRVDPSFKRRMKKSVKFLNDKFLKNEVLKDQPQVVVKLNEEINTLKTTLAKFVGGIENLDKLLRYKRCPTNKSSHGYEREIYVHDDDIVVCYFVAK